MRKIKKKTPKHAFFNDPSPTLNGLPPFLSLVFPSSLVFLSDFISWPFLQLVSCFQITLLPTGRALLYHLPLFIPHSRLSSALMRTKTFPPSCHLRLPSPLLFYSLFLPPKTRPVPRTPAISPPAKTKVLIKLFLMETPQQLVKGYDKTGTVCSETWRIKSYKGYNQKEFLLLDINLIFPKM